MHSGRLVQGSQIQFVGSVLRAAYFKAWGSSALVNIGTRSYIGWLYNLTGIYPIHDAQSAVESKLLVRFPASFQPWDPFRSR